MVKISDKLSLIFKRNPKGVLKDLTGAIDVPLNTVRADLDELQLQYLISTATGTWLDEWGSWFGVFRVLDESDDSYRKRIIATTTRPKNTPNAIMEAVKTYIGDPNAEVRVYEPFQDVRKFNISTFSGKDKFQDGDYYRNGVIDINLPIYPSQIIIDTIKQIKSAGIRAYFSQITVLRDPEGGPLKMYSKVPPEWEYWSQKEIPFHDVRGTEFSGFLNYEGRSGRQVLFPDYRSLHELGYIFMRSENDIHNEVYSAKEFFVPLPLQKVYFDQWRYSDLSKYVFKDTSTIDGYTLRVMTLLAPNTASGLFPDYGREHQSIAPMTVVLSYPGYTREATLQVDATATSQYPTYAREINIINPNTQGIIITDSGKYSDLYAPNTVQTHYQDTNRYNDFSSLPALSTIEFSDTARVSDVDYALGAKVMIAGSNKVLNDLLTKTIYELGFLPDDSQPPVQSVTSSA